MSAHSDKIDGDVKKKDMKLQAEKIGEQRVGISKERNKNKRRKKHRYATGLGRDANSIWAIMPMVHKLKQG